MADKIIRLSNLSTFLTKLKGLFVTKESGKGLSTNDYTSAEKISWLVLRVAQITTASLPQAPIHLAGLKSGPI